LVVAGALRASSGLGQSARLCVEALREDGASIAGIDLSHVLRQDLDVPLPKALVEAGSGPGTLILHVNAPLCGLALLAIGRHRAYGKRIIGYWAWELPEVPAEWKLGVELVHEIWAPSTFTATAIARIAGGRPVRVVPHAVALGPRPDPAPRRPGAPFTVLCLFDAASSVSRKNPEGGIIAFRRAFGDDPGARLVLKTQRLDAAPEQAARLRALAAAPNIHLINSVMDQVELNHLFAEADVLLSLHRAEGFGLALAEAMRRGIAVIATGWSGNADFLTPEVGVPIPWRLVPAEDPQRTYHMPSLRWADPDLDAAAEALLALRLDPDRRARLGSAAANYAEAHWSGKAYRAKLRELGVPA
jgi:glycosyltransferase involved in cell wall biosynthesis